MDGIKKIELTPTQVNQINAFIIDCAKYVPEKVKASARWQNKSTKALRSLLGM
jgi:hypothetical protein